MNKTKTIVIIAVMSALAFVLYAYEMSVAFILPATAFLKMDFSDIPVILTALTTGFIPGSFVALLKNIFHILISKDPSFTGEIANFFYSFSFILPFAVIKGKTFKNIVIGCIIGIIASTIIMCLVNYFITLPLYGLSNKGELIISAFIPFNIFKGIVLSLLAALIYPKIKTLVEK